jgi:hypothetical protein
MKLQHRIIKVRVNVKIHRHLTKIMFKSILLLVKDVSNKMPEAILKTKFLNMNLTHLKLSGRQIIDISYIKP